MFKPNISETGTGQGKLQLRKLRQFALMTFCYTHKSVRGFILRNLKIIGLKSKIVVPRYCKNGPSVLKEESKNLSFITITLRYGRTSPLNTI